MLLAILTLGAASAAENVTADDLAVGDAGNLEVPASDEIIEDGDISNVASGDKEILSASQEEKLSDSFNVIVINGTNYDDYFNQTDGGKLVDSIKAGDTLDIQGSIISPNASNKIFMDINKPINIISTTGDGYIDLDTTAHSVMGSLPDNSFVISNGGSYSNVTGITFHNTQMWITNTTHVVLDSIRVIIEQDIGSGVGSTSIRDNTTFLTLKNSYFYTKSNGGAAAFTLSWADHCTIDNNTFIMGQGVAAACLSYNAFNIPGVSPTNNTINSYNNFTNNYIASETGASLRVQAQRGGNYNLFENNTFVKCAVSSGGTLNKFIGNNITSGGSLSPSADSIVYNNTVLGALTVLKGDEVYNNTFEGLILSGADALVHDNIINGASTINSGNGAQVYDNTFIGDYTITFKNQNAKNITFANNDIIGNIEFGNKNAKGNKIVNNTITTSKDYAIDLKTYTGTETNITDNILNSKKGFGNNAVNHADDSTLIIDNYQSANATISVLANDIKVGETAFVNVTANETSIKSVDVIVNGKKYVLNLVEGKGSLELADLLSGNYDVIVTSNDLTYGGQNATAFEVNKDVNPVILVDAPAKTQWIDSNITVTIADATGTVTLDINGSEFTEELVDGVAVFAIPDFTPGAYDYNITYSGDYKYFGNTTNGTLTVNKNKEVKIIAFDIVDYGLANKFTAQFTNYLGEAIADANVTITVDDEIFSLVTDENGTATANFVLFRGNYDVNVTFKEIPNEFDAASAEYAIKVIDRSVINIVSVNGDGLITGMLCDSIEEPIANAEIIASMDGSNTTVTTNDAGLFEFKAKNGLIVQFKFEGDNITTASDASITLNNVVHDLRDVSIIKITSIDGQDIITGLLADTTGNPIANATVIAKMNGAETTLTTDNAGLFKFQSKNGCEVTFEFAGDNTTTPANASIALNYLVPELKGTSINVSSVSRSAADTGAGEKGKAYKFTLNDALGNALANKTVQVALNGKVYKAVTNENGTASIVISLNTAKTYNLNAFFIGDNDYKGSTAAVKVTITKKKTTLKAAKTKYTFKAKAKSKVIKATLKTSNKYLKAGKKVTINIKGKTYTAKTGKNGAVKLNIKALSKKGTYKAKIKFAGDSTYKASSSKTIKIVIK